MANVDKLVFPRGLIVCGWVVIAGPRRGAPNSGIIVVGGRTIARSHIRFFLVVGFSAGRQRIIRDKRRNVRIPRRPRGWSHCIRRRLVGRESNRIDLRLLTSGGAGRFIGIGHALLELRVQVDGLPIGIGVG